MRVRRASISLDAVKYKHSMGPVRRRAVTSLPFSRTIENVSTDPDERTTTRLFDSVVGSRSIRPHTCLTTPAPKALHESLGQQIEPQASILGESRLIDAERERCRVLCRLRLWREAVDRRKSRRRRTDQHRRSGKAATAGSGHPRRKATCAGPWRNRRVCSSEKRACHLCGRCMRTRAAERWRPGRGSREGGALRGCAKGTCGRRVPACV